MLAWLAWLELCVGPPTSAFVLLVAMALVDADYQREDAEGQGETEPLYLLT